MSTPTLAYVCLASIYLLWGATYFAIRIVVEQIPPLLAAMLRHGCAGLIILIILTLLGKMRELPSVKQFLNALLIGSLTLGLSNGALMWAEVRVPSAFVAIAFALMPLFTMLFNYLGFARSRPTSWQLLALLLGCIGVSIVVAAGKTLTGEDLQLFDLGLLLFSPAMWAYGSLLSKTKDLPKSIFKNSGLQMCGAAILLCIFGTLHGDWQQGAWDHLDKDTIWALLYLTFGGSLIGFTHSLWPSNTSILLWLGPMLLPRQLLR